MAILPNAWQRATLRMLRDVTNQLELDLGLNRILSHYSVPRPELKVFVTAVLKASQGAV